MSLTLRAFGKSDVGRKRSNNQDSFLVNEELSLFAVADGMGGHSGGEVASAVAIRTLETLFKEKSDQPIPERMSEIIQLCNKAIFEQAKVNPKLTGMGTTLTAAVVDGSWIHIGQVGDSRCYLFRDAELYQITEDHSQVYELLKAGIINEANMAAFQKNIITRSVGYMESVNVDLFSRLAQKGDRYLLCSDGLSGMVSNEDISRILGNFPIDEASMNLVDLANQHGGEDNVSVVVFETS
jgi:PPM family protein phosphatase